MSDYFTPVGELPELIRARGSQINDREDAVTTGFDNVEADVATIFDELAVPNFAVDTGTANAYLVELDPAPTAYLDGMEVAFRPITKNNGPSTVDVNGLGPIPIYKSGNTALVATDIAAGVPVVLRYSSTFARFFMASPGIVLPGSTDFTPNITFGTNWNDAAALTKLTLSGNIATLQLAAISSGAPGATIMTLPTLCRPYSMIDGAVGTLINHLGLYYPAYANITTAGIVTMGGFNGTGGFFSISSGAAYRLHVSYLAT